ncbi:MAG TPA: haloalkane dehalogenase [Gaiellaceae bacterium]|nr:haloalkane dehalogenase [Gaiellaceae bacterium]
MNAYRTPDECFGDLPGYPWQPHYLDLDGLRLHYLDEGAGPPVLLLHGEPTWSYLYRTVIPELTPACRVVAPDYLGFGRSDKPLRLEDYSYDLHVASIQRLVEALDLRDLTVVVQDWGGPIGLRVAVEQPERVARLVLMNTGVGGGRPPSEEWLRFRDFVRRVGPELLPGRLVRISCIRPLSDEVEEAYSAPWPVPESKAGVLAFPELVPTEPEHPNTAPLLRVRDAVARWEKPALVLFSDSDPIFRPEAAERLARLIPGAGPAEIVARAGHFLQEDAGPEVGRRIARFVTG